MFSKVSSREEVCRRGSDMADKNGGTHCWGFHSIHSVFYDGTVVGVCTF